MAGSTYFPSGSAEAFERYGRELADATKHRDWIHDPSIALAGDPLVYAKVLRDPVAAHAIRFRKHLVAGQAWTVAPADESRPADKVAAKLLDQLLGKLEGFTDARVRLGDAIFRGSAYARISGARRWLSLDGGPYQAWWVPTRLVDVDRRRFRLVPGPFGPAWELWSVQREAWEPIPEHELRAFVRSVFDDSEASLGYGSGLLDTLYYYHGAKARVLRDALRASERFGMGFLKIAVEGMRQPGAGPHGPERSNANHVAAWKTAMAKQVAEHALVHDKADQVDLVTGAGDGWQILRQLLGYLDVAMVTAVLGSSLNTMQSLDEVGSNAKAVEHANSMEALVQADRARLSGDVTRDLVGLVWALNRNALELQAPGAERPEFRIVQQKSEDPERAANVVATLVGAGVELKAEEVYEKTGFTPPLPGEATVGGSSGGGGGLPGLSPFGGPFSAARDESLALLLREEFERARAPIHLNGATPKP